MSALRTIFLVSILLSVTCCSATASLESGSYSQPATENKDSNLITQPMQTDIIECDGREIEVFKTQGSQHPIVFINGFRMPLSNWTHVINDLRSKDNSITLVSYNRPGVGKSARTTEPQRGSVVVEDMEATLQCADISEPVILVAHSIGGIFANLYARKYSSRVAGLILVDAPHPDEILEQKSQGVPFILNALNNSFKFLEKKLNPYKFSEDEEIITTIEEFHSAQPFPSIPVIVITGTRKMPFAPESSMEIHQRYQVHLLDLSPQSTHILADGSGHFPQIDQPDLVSDAILTLLDEISSKQ